MAFGVSTRRCMSIPTRAFCRNAMCIVVDMFRMPLVNLRRSFVAPNFINTFLVQSYDATQGNNLPTATLALRVLGIVAMIVLTLGILTRQTIASMTTFDRASPPCTWPARLSRRLLPLLALDMILFTSTWDLGSSNEVPRYSAVPKEATAAILQLKVLAVIATATLLWWLGSLRQRQLADWEEQERLRDLLSVLYSRPAWLSGNARRLMQLYAVECDTTASDWLLKMLLFTNGRYADDATKARGFYGSPCSPLGRVVWRMAISRAISVASAERESAKRRERRKLEAFSAAVDVVSAAIGLAIYTPGAMSGRLRRRLDAMADQLLLRWSITRLRAISVMRFRAEQSVLPAFSSEAENVSERITDTVSSTHTSGRGRKNILG
eukprot:GHVT01059684.1.p1 GENE.GHVT01059684.1~~GHVT01059684.1.p1  ORF type:complete len:380 (-),score=22.55 GHVT01059684.1:2101-3240(-)